MTTAATIWAELRLDSRDFNNGLDTALNKLRGFEGNLRRVGSSLTQIGGMMTAAITVPVLAAGAAIVKTSSDMDTQMRNIQSISRQTDEEIAALRKQFIDMSTDLTKTTDSAEVLAQGFYFIQSSGFAGADAMRVLEVSTKAASAGLSSTDTAARAIIATLNAYNMEAGDAAHVSDVLFKTVDLGVLTFDDLANQLGDVVSTAATTNVSIEEVGGAISVMTRRGISAAESVTSLNQLLLQFISPSNKTAGAARAMGVELSIATLKSKGLRGALQEIMEKGGPNAFMELFGDNVRALRGALALTSDGMVEFNDIMGQMGDVTGRTQEAFETQTKSFAAQWANFMNTAKAVAMSFGEVVLPVLTKLLQMLQPVLKVLQALPAPLKFIIVVLALLAAALGPIIMFVGQIFMFAAALGQLGITMSSVVTFITTLGSALGTFISFITTTAIPAIVAFVVANAAWILPLLLIAATVYLVYLAFKNNFMGITTTVQQLGFIIKFYFNQMANDVRNFFVSTNGQQSGFQQWTSSLGTTVQQLGFIIKFYFSQAVQDVIWFFSTYEDGSNRFVDMSNKIKKWFSDMVNKVVSGINRLKSAWNAGVTYIYNLANRIFNSIITLVNRVISSLQSLGSAFSNIKPPSFLTPGSPTPFENGLAGVNKQLNAMTEDRLPRLALKLSAVKTAPVSSNSRSVQYVDQRKWGPGISSEEHKKSREQTLRTLEAIFEGM